MLPLYQIKEKIKEIDAAFHCFQLNGSPVELLECLADFERKTFQFIADSRLNAIVKWYKNLFFQKAFLFQRAEELLDEALDIIDDQKDTYFFRWKVKIYISLGYVHRDQWNYLDAEFYLTYALELARSVPELHKFLGEIYSCLSHVNLLLSRHHQANSYAAMERRVSRERYQTRPEDKNSGVVYAYALINHSRIRRMMGVLDQANEIVLKKPLKLHPGSTMKDALSCVIWKSQNLNLPWTRSDVPLIWRLLWNPD